MVKKRKSRFQVRQTAQDTHIARPYSKENSRRNSNSSWTNKPTNQWAAAILSIIGIIVYFPGLASPFQGDDTSQIVQNVPVHSIANFFLFFRGGTFYLGNGLAPLFGSYFRPWMSVMYSLIYTLFGENTVPFHTLQLAFFIGGAILVYRFFCYSFNRLASLFFALVILVHPLNSQVVYSIACLQDAMFFFFGMLALNFLVRTSNNRGLYFACGSLVLGLLSKESGLLFIAISLLYLFWFNRDRLRTFIYIPVPVMVVYAIVRISAVGLFHNPMSSPVDSLSLFERILMIPSLMVFYLAKFIFPLHLASGYFWVSRGLSWQHVLLPLTIIAAVLGAIVYLAWRIRRTASEGKFYTFLFFGIWAALGLVEVSQIAPLDMTACETWFLFSMIGSLGMIGTAWTSLVTGVYTRTFIVLAILTLTLLGGRTFARGFDWGDPNVLAMNDVATDPSNILANGILTGYYVNNGQFDRAFTYAKNTVNTFPEANEAYNNLGIVQVHRHQYADALAAFQESVKLDNNAQQAYEHVGALLLVYDDPSLSGLHSVEDGMKKYPRDTTLLSYVAMLDYKNGDLEDAQKAVDRLATLGAPNPQLGSIIASGGPLNVQIQDFGNVHIR